MLRKDHEQPFSPSRVPWQHRRLQRSVAIAFFILTLLVFALYRQQKIPIVTELHLDTITGLHRYGSAPEAGRPSLPFNDDAHRKTDPEPFFEMPDNDDDSDGEEDAESLEGPTTQLPEIPVIPGEAFASTDKPALPTLETTDEASAEFKEGPKAQDTMSITQVQKKPISPELVALDPTKVALLLETRPLPHLPALLSHFISVLPLPWTFRFVGSPASISLIERSAALRNHIKTGKLILTNLPKKYPINSQEAISTTLVDISFYQEFLAPAEWLLVFQSDSIVCSGFDGSIEDYVAKGYTWVGAPWNLGNEFGGNGGLSLRHVPPIIKVLETEKRKAGSDWEDRWLCDRLGKMDASNMPAPEIERHFSVEAIWTDRPFGYHLRGSGKYLEDDIWGDPNRRKAIYEYCPEIKIVLDMDLSDEIANMRKELAAIKKEMINKSAEILGISNKEVLEKAVENATAQAAKDTANETAGNVAAERIHG